jgi:4-amino-4-deoxy-L-arabinose transferase-like glycosyltransferase
MIGFIKKYPLTVLIIVSVVMLFSNLGLIQTNIMEARNLITAREMVNDGHWIFTTLNGLPRYEKPPLPTWITALFMMIGGMQNMFVLRLPVALVCLMLVYFFYRLAGDLQLKNNQPLNASLILITSFYIFFAGRDNQWDIYTHAFMIACVFFLFRVFNEKTGTAKNIVLSGLFLGCSFLSKGPVSLYALFLPFVISYFIVYNNKTGRSLKLLLFVLVIGLAIGLSWPLYVKYFDVVAGTALSKQTQNWGNYEVKPFYYYWSFFTQSGIWTIPSLIALMYFYMRRRVENVKAYNFSFWWTILSVVLLSVIPEKKARYLLPVLIPMAMNTSFYIEYLIHNFKQIKNKTEAGVVNFSFGLIGVIAIALPFVLFFIFKARLNAYILWYIILVAVSIFSGVLILKGLIKIQFNQTFYAIIFFMCGLIVTVIPLSKIYYTNKNYYAAVNLNSIEKKLDIKSYEAGEYVPEIIWSYGKPMHEISDNKIVTMPKDSLFGLLIYPGESTAFIQNFKNYSFTKIAVVDLNEISPESKGYNERLVKNYYLVKKAYTKN